MFLLKFKILKFRQKNKCDKRKLFIYVLNELTDKKTQILKGTSLLYLTKHCKLFDYLDHIFTTDTLTLHF